MKDTRKAAVRLFLNAMVIAKLLNLSANAEPIVSTHLQTLNFDSRFNGRHLVAHLGFEKSSYLAESFLAKQIRTELSELPADTVHIVPVVGTQGLANTFSKVLVGASAALRQRFKSVAMVSSSDWEDKSVQALCAPFDYVLVTDPTPVGQAFSEVVAAHLRANSDPNLMTRIYVKEGGNFAQSTLLQILLRQRYSYFGQSRRLHLELSAGYLPSDSKLEDGVMAATGIAAEYERIHPYLRGTDVYFSVHDELNVADQLLFGHTGSLSLRYVSYGEKQLRYLIELYQSARLHAENWHIYTSPQGNQVLIHLENDEVRLWLGTSDKTSLDRTDQGELSFKLHMDGDALVALEDQSLTEVMVANPGFIDQTVFMGRYMKPKNSKQGDQYEEFDYSIIEEDDNLFSSQRRRISFVLPEFDKNWVLIQTGHEVDLSEVLVAQAMNALNVGHLFHMSHMNILSDHMHAVDAGTSDVFIKPLPDRNSDFYTHGQMAILNGLDIRGQVVTNYDLVLEELNALIEKAQSGQATENCLGIFAKK